MTTSPATDAAAPPGVLRRARIATAATFVAQGFSFSVLLTHLPQYTDKYHLSQGSLTLMVLMVVVLSGAGSVFAELLATRTSSRFALQAGLFAVAATAAAVAFAPGTAAFFGALALYGIAVGSVDATGNMQAVAV